MDPNQCLADIKAAIRQGDIVTARDRWDELAAWTAMGGFPPHDPVPPRP